MPTATDVINNSFQYVFGNSSTIAPRKNAPDFVGLLNAVLKNEAVLNGGSLSLLIPTSSQKKDTKEKLPVIFLKDLSDYHGSCLDPLSLSGSFDEMTVPIDLIPLAQLFQNSSCRNITHEVFPYGASYVNSEDKLYLYPQFSCDLILRYKPFPKEITNVLDAFPNWITGDFLYFIEMRLAKEISLIYNIDSWNENKEVEMNTRAEKCTLRNTSNRNFSRKNPKELYVNFNQGTSPMRLRYAR